MVTLRLRRARQFSTLPVGGRGMSSQEASPSRPNAYNGHFESTCYHLLLLFNREGDCLAAKLRPGNVHSAEGWEELLLPEIERQQAQGQEVVFRADAAFAKPELYEALEERDVKYAIRLPANDNLQRNVPELLIRPGTAEPQASGAVQELSLSGRQLEAGASGGGEGGVPLRGVIPPRGFHRDQPGGLKPGGGAVLQQARDSRAVDKGRQAGGRDDAAFLSCHRFCA